VNPGFLLFVAVQTTGGQHLWRESSVNRKRRRVGLRSLVMVYRSIGVVLSISFYLFSCSTTQEIFRVQELDNCVINLENIQRTSHQEEIKAVLGEPHFVHELHGEGKLVWTTWRYPIRHIDAVPLPTGAKAQRQVIPAVELKIWLDTSGRVDKWGFSHPKTHSPMEIRESIKQVDAWFGKMRNPPRRIELAEVLKRGTSKDDILKGMYLFEAKLVSEEVKRSQVRFSREEEREVLTYYADHPSPLYVPPFFVVVTFYVMGGLRTGWHFESVYGGDELF
jgi:hypothetical protein